MPLPGTSGALETSGISAMSFNVDALEYARLELAQMQEKVEAAKRRIRDFEEYRAARLSTQVTRASPAKVRCSWKNPENEKQKTKLIPKLNFRAEKARQS